MKYFNINYEDRYFSHEELKAACKADPVTHIAMMQMLQIQCRADGYQPYIWPDNNGVEILPATKAFLNWTAQPNKTARRVMAQIEAMENA